MTEIAIYKTKHPKIIESRGILIWFLYAEELRHRNIKCLFCIFTHYISRKAEYFVQQKW